MKKLKLLLFLLIMLLAFSFTYSQTYHSGPTTQNEIWSLAGNPHIITGNITVPSTYILTIEAGCNIEFQSIQGTPPTKYSISVDGSIYAVGTSSNNITFTALDQNIGWDGINISNNSSDNLFTYCIFEYVKKNPITCTNNFASSGAVYLNSSTYTSFTNCIFQYNETCTGGGIAFYSSVAQVIDCSFYYNDVQENGGGIFISNGINNSFIENCNFENNDANNGGGLYLEDCNSDISISLNEFRYNNATNGAGAYFTNVTSANPFHVFAENQLFQNIASNNGGGLYINSSNIDIVNDNYYESNEALNGAGIYLDETIITNLLSNDCQGNIASDNGGALLLNESFAYLKLSKIIGNIAQNEGGGIFITGMHQSGDVNHLINNLIVENTADNNGGGIFSHEDFQSLNNTIANNVATFGIGGGIYNQYQTADIVNTILWGNTATSNPQAYPTPDGNNGYSYCCCPTVTNCPTCQTINPLFVGSGNYMITYGSSCYESGDNNVQHEAFDLNGNSRICHNVIDIGAYEDPYIYKSGDICDQTWTNHNPNGIDYVITDNITVRCTLTIQNGTTIAFEDGKKMDVQGSLDAQGNSLNYITFTAINPNNGWGGIRFNGTSSQYSSEFDYCILEYSKKSDPPTPYGYCQCGIFTAYYNGGAIYLKDFGNIDISNSIFRYNFASRGGAIYVYSSNASVIEPSISNNNEFYQNESCKGGAICLQGNENNKFKLQADINYNTFHDNFSMRLGGAVFTDIYDNSEITGNTFNNNEADIEDNFSKGGAVLFCGGSKNQFKNNTLYNNTAKTGGALCVNYGTAFTGTDPVIEGNSIYSNNAVNGGGVAFISSTKLSAYNTKFYSNKVYENEAYRDGGGIYIKGFSPIIYNSLIVNNTSTDDGGGIYDTNSVSKYYNCTIADNNADEGGGVYSPDITSFPEFRNDIIYDNLPDDVIFNNSPPDVGDPYYNYCDIGNFTFNQSGPSNFSADPKFVDGYHLKYGNPAPPYTSPCINSGDPNFTPPTNYDLDNNTRVADGRIDMGCYENDGSNQNWWIVFNNINDDEHNDLSINVYPNPVDDQLTLKIDSKIDNNFTIQMYNSLGKIEYNEHRDIKIGENIIYLNRNQLAAGIYYLKVSSAFINLKVMKIIFK